MNEEIIKIEDIVDGLKKEMANNSYNNSYSNNYILQL